MQIEVKHVVPSKICQGNQAELDNNLLDGGQEGLKRCSQKAQPLLSVRDDLMLALEHATKDLRHLIEFFVHGRVGE